MSQFILSTANKLPIAAKLYKYFNRSNVGALQATILSKLF